MAAVALEKLSISEVSTDGISEVLQSNWALAHTLSHASDLETLISSTSVCRLWRSVLQDDDIFKAVYLRTLPVPQDYECVGSYRQQFQRLRGLLAMSLPQPTALKGQALCYNATTGNLVSYNERQRMVSVQMPDGSIRSEVTDIEGAGTAHRALLSSTGSELVVLAAFDGALQLWDAAECKPSGLLGSHPSFITSLDASGQLVASTCSAELRLWQLDGRQCLFQVPIGLPMPSPVLEPHVAVCHKQQLLALANCAAPAPSSVVKVYSTQPAGSSSNGTGSSSSSSSRPIRAAAAGQQQPQIKQPPPGSVSVGSSSCPDATGALLLRELPVNAAADMLLLPGLLLVASCFHGRSVSSNTPYRSERPFTVVVQIWDTCKWQLTRLVSPRLWTDYPIYTMQGTPIISLTQGTLLCATLRSGLTKPTPSCCIHAWTLPSDLARAGQPAAAAAAAADGRGQPGSSSGHSSLCLLSVSPSKKSSMDAAGALGAGSGSCSSSSSARGAEPFGEGGVALGRAAVATAGGAGAVGVSSTNTVMLAVSDQERDNWLPLLEDTEGRLTVMLTTPTQLVMATETGLIVSSRLLPAEATEVPAGGQQQQQDGSAVAVQLATEVDGRLIHVDL